MEHKNLAPKDLGAYLWTCRKSSGLTTEELEGKSGVSERTIKGIECGKGNPTLKTLEALLTSLNISVTLSH